MAQGHLVGSAANGTATITLNTISFRDYDLRLKFTILSTNQQGFCDFILKLPVVRAPLCIRTKGTQSTIGFWQQGKKGKNVLEGGALARPLASVIQVGKPYTVMVQVRGNGNAVAVFLNDKRVLSLDSLPGVADRASEEVPLSFVISPNGKVAITSAVAAEPAAK